MRAGAVGRVDLLNKSLDRLAINGKQTLATVTSAMNAGATQDVRAIDTVPLLVRLLQGTSAPSPQAQQMLDLMVAWAAGGAGGVSRVPAARRAISDMPSAASSSRSHGNAISSPTVPGTSAALRSARLRRVRRERARTPDLRQA